MSGVELLVSYGPALASYAPLMDFPSLLVTIVLPLVQVGRPAEHPLLDRVADRSLSVEVREEALMRVAESDRWLSYEQVSGLRNMIRRTWQGDYVRCLSRTDDRALEELEEWRKRNDEIVRAEAILGIVTLGGATGSRVARQVMNDERAPATSKVAALRGLQLTKSPWARVESLRHLRTGTGISLLEALKVLRVHPDEEDLKYLVEFLARDVPGRPTTEALHLLQERTGYRMGREVKTWRYWLRLHQAEGTPFYREPSPTEEDPKTLSYFGIQILGERVCFVLDASGSMAQPMAERTGTTRGAQAVHELAALLPRLPARGGFGLVFFESAVHHYAPRLLAPESRNLNGANAWLERRSFEGGTNLFGGLEAAFALENLEEIVLLSDGAPTQGRIVDAEEILRQVRRWNRWRMLRVSAVGLGVRGRERSFLADLAEENDGSVRFLR